MISDPLNRAKQTAQIVAEAIHITVSEDSRLRERANWGDSPGQTFEEFVEMWNRAPRNETICLQLEIPQEEPVSG